jgi:hypothetical protein
MRASSQPGSRNWIDEPTMRSRGSRSTIRRPGRCAGPVSTVTVERVPAVHLRGQVGKLHTQDRGPQMVHPAGDIGSLELYIFERIHRGSGGVTPKSM